MLHSNYFTAQVLFQGFQVASNRQFVASYLGVGQPPTLTILLDKILVHRELMNPGG
jgi:hypothetical protein